MSKVTICVDFDGTIVDHEFPAIGPLKNHVLGVLSELIKRYDIVISSCRAAKKFNPEGPGTSKAYKEMVEFIHANKVPHTSIDDGTNGKIIASYYIDDRALPFDNNWSVILKGFNGIP